MQRIYKDYDPYHAVTEASFTNMAMSRVFLTAETCYTLSFMWDVYYENQKAVETAKFSSDAGGETDDTTYIDRKIRVALVAVCYAILATLVVQMFAVVN